MMPGYELADFVGELDAAFGRQAVGKAVSLVLTAYDNGRSREVGILTSAAIMLCHERYRCRAGVRND